MPWSGCRASGSSVAWPWPGALPQSAVLCPNTIDQEVAHREQFGLDLGHVPISGGPTQVLDQVVLLPQEAEVAAQQRVLHGLLGDAERLPLQQHVPGRVGALEEDVCF